MKQLFILLILTIPLFSQHTLPNFGAAPAEVWKFLKIDPPDAEVSLVGTELTNYLTVESYSTDSLEGAMYTFHRDSLVRVSYYYGYRGDLTQAVEFFEKKNKGYEWGHGSRQRFIILKDCGSIWYDFTLPQIAQFINSGHSYESDYYMKKDYRLVTYMSHLHEFNFTKYTVSFISEDAYIRGIL